MSSNLDKLIEKGLQSAMSEIPTMTKNTIRELKELGYSDYEIANGIETLAKELGMDLTKN